MAIDSVELPAFTEIKSFSVLGTPLLTKGRTQELVAVAPGLWLHAKVYSDEAERYLHSHNNEDHAFFILSGKARFRKEDGTEVEIGAFEGMMVPRGVRYSFESCGEGNLVMLRIGSDASSEQNDAGRAKLAAVLGGSTGPTKVVTPEDDRTFAYSGEVFDGT